MISINKIQYFWNTLPCSHVKKYRVRSRKCHSNVFDRRLFEFLEYLETNLAFVIILFLRPTEYFSEFVIENHLRAEFCATEAAKVFQFYLVLND